MDQGDTPVPSFDPPFSSSILPDVFDTIEVGMGIVDPETGRYLLANRKWCDLLGYSREELYRLKVQEMTHPEDWEKTRIAIEEVQKGSRKRCNLEKRFIRKDGTVFWGLLIANVLGRGEGERILISGVVLDIDEKKRIEFQFQKEKDITRALSEINALILKRPEPELLFRESCRIAVEFGGFLATWVAMIDPVSLETRQTGLFLKDPSIQDTIERIHISVDPDQPHGRGSVGQSYRSGKPVIFNSYSKEPATAYWQEDARRNKVQSAGSFPIRKSGEIIAVMVILADREGYFEPEGIALLAKVADSISFALDEYEKGQDLFLTSQVFDSVPEGILITDPGGVIQKANEAMTHLSGFLSADLLGQSVGVLEGKAGSGQLLKTIQECVDQSMSLEGVFQNVRKDGLPYTAEATVTPLLNRQNEIVHCVTILKDVTAKVERDQEIWRLANIDELTGLLNRIALGERLKVEMAHVARSGGAIALCFLDFDEFKAINDTMGHGAGDQLLKAIGLRLASSVRSTDIVARLGGDEFVIGLVFDHDPSPAIAFVHALLDVISSPVVINAQSVQITASVGIALFPKDAVDVEELLRRADIAMYQAKNKGKNTWQFFDPDMESRILTRYDQEKRLKAGLQEGNFILHYQPQVDVVRNQMVGVEALARWPESGCEMNRPSDFIPLAEETGVILPFGEWVLDEAFKAIRGWSDMGRPRIRVGVNVSSRQFWSPSFWDFLGQRILEMGDLAHWLTLELTESLLMKDPEGAGQQLEWLRERGIRIAIDDFGTGYSSLVYLSRLPVDEIKVSQEFVMRMMRSPRDLLLVRTIIQLGRSLNLKLVGEGAETEEEQRMLEELGCPVIQGYVLSRPLSKIDLESYWDLHSKVPER